MSTNYDLYKAELVTKANALTVTEQKYKALIYIDQYISALTQQATATANDVQSYSIGDRSVTRSTAQGYTNLVNRLESQLRSILGGGSVTYADFRVNSNQDQN